MLRRSCLCLRMNGMRWNQGTEMYGVNDAEPWHPMSTVFTGDLNQGHKRVQPTFMKEEFDFDTYNSVSPVSKNLATMFGGSPEERYMRKYQKLYEKAGGVDKRTKYKMTQTPIWPDRKVLPRTKGYRDRNGYFHDDQEQLLQFRMPDMTDTDLKAYVK